MSKPQSASFSWQLGYSQTRTEEPAEWYPARVPGSVQQDYAAAKGWPPFYQGTEYTRYAFAEDVWWHYKTPLFFECDAKERAFLHFEGIDYRYTIQLNGEVLCRGEGMFTPVELEVTPYAGKPATLEVILDPAPKADSTNSRSQARYSCKPPACYGWDWHPRLVTAGLWGAVTLELRPRCCLSRLEAAYRLDEERKTATLQAQVSAGAEGTVRFSLEYDGKTVAEDTVDAHSGMAQATLTVENPRLWYPVGYGAQPRYRLVAQSLTADRQVLQEMSRPVGFRRVRLVMNEGNWETPFPKSRNAAPATLEVNGRRLFAKGTNWVNATVFPADMTPAVYRELLEAVRDANMNIVRVWGGGFVNTEAFFDLCDEMGILVWQEFPLACNEYPDDDRYLSVLTQEATTIVRRLRTHPCLALWCGGNELFNTWSDMTDQHHALRLLNTVCYQEDRFTPFIATSPLFGMAHGHYTSYDLDTGLESLTMFHEARNTAYTEFGNPGMASPDTLGLFLTEKDLADFSPENPVWTAHHAFGAWGKNYWSDPEAVRYFYGDWTDTADFIEKTQAIQAMSYRSCFEEMRRQWPSCSMALNWCFNEPWPTAANNSLLSWPAVKRPAYGAVQAALRPQMASLELEKQLWKGGEVFRGQVWMLNDTIESLEDCEIRAFITVGGEKHPCGVFRSGMLAPQTNRECGGLAFRLPEELNGSFTVTLEVVGQKALSSVYTYLCKGGKRPQPPVVRILNR